MFQRFQSLQQICLGNVGPDKKEANSARGVRDGARDISTLCGFQRLHQDRGRLPGHSPNDPDPFFGRLEDGPQPAIIRTFPTNSVVTDTHRMDNTFANAHLWARLRWLTFLRQWIKSPLSMASVAPSGRQLARLMVAALPQGSRTVIELGAGTGAITDAVLRCGIPAKGLMAVELNPVLHRLMQQRFPQVHSVCADAQHVESVVLSTDGFGHDGVDAVCSSLGLLTMPHDRQYAIVAAAFRLLRPDGVFIQYTYGPRHPMAEVVRESLNLHCLALGLAWRNLPPARVYVYSRRASP